MMEVHLTQKTETHLPVKMAKLLNGTYVMACRPMGGIRHARIGQKRDSHTANFSVCNTDKKNLLARTPTFGKWGYNFFSLAPLMNHVLSPFLKSRRRSWPEPFSSDNIKKETTAK